MTSDSLFSLFKNISVRKVNGVYSLYKPLVLLYALSKVSHGEDRLIYYSNIDESLNQQTMH
ncbi:hypothetical protein BPLS_P2860 [Bathymodiolus platifrons methanotrophic gill symbiont]|nr:hypothetical protein BJAS_P3612 [Bathymodiolus japonicus methanotrophic gill symbiont]GFO75557.1 hypothetical protein BPLS_P2860 [Bathymodiolus platifrons methanotrophic gill symbiont]